ncbi:HIG1 domain family member 2A, mitochondrial [Lamellibrachia satsuma]|nr:HIG1 domain family member 2A, mitochondrial [Lamellibrachia satsuma]
MSDPKGSKMIPPHELGYLEMPSNLNLGDDFFERPTGESFADKAMRKSKENPFVPLGLGATLMALSAGLWTLKTGNRAHGQKMMRYRVFAQSFTLFALIAGMAYTSFKKSKADNVSKS